MSQRRSVSGSHIGMVSNAKGTFLPIKSKYVKNEPSVPVKSRQNTIEFKLKS